jgi:hypothetical protein
VANKQCVICGTVYDPTKPPGRPMTCGDDCHAEMKRILIKNHGEFKKCVAHNGVAYRVPTEDIIEKGIKESDLAKYPRWDEPQKGSAP